MKKITEDGHEVVATGLTWEQVCELVSCHPHCKKCDQHHEPEAECGSGLAIAQHNQKPQNPQELIDAEAGKTAKFQN